MGRLDGKVVLLTGTSQGLGAEVMRLFAREGAAVTGAELAVDCGHLVM